MAHLATTEIALLGCDYCGEGHLTHDEVAESMGKYGEVMCEGCLRARGMATRWRADMSKPTNI